MFYKWLTKLALNVLPSPKEPNQKSNLFGLLNKCKTPMGSRLLMQWLKQPLKDINHLQERLDLVDIFYSDQNMSKELRTHCFKRIPDLERIAKKIQMNNAGKISLNFMNFYTLYFFSSFNMSSCFFMNSFTCSLMKIFFFSWVFPLCFLFTS